MTPREPLDLPLKDGAARFDGGLPPSHHSAWALASLDVLAQAGMDDVLERGPAPAERLAELLGERGLTVAPRGRSTLVSWETADNRGRVHAAARGGLRGAPPPGHALRAGLGGRVDERRRARAAGGRSRSLVLLGHHHDAETMAAATTANAINVSTA